MTADNIHPTDLRVPPAAPGMAIGLYGGSFNPPHDGHYHVAFTALKRLALDRVWWLVSPGNPLKDHGELDTLAKRLGAAKQLADHPKFTVTALETGHGLTYSADTVAFLRAERPRIRFVWIMGADNLAEFHRWRRWRQIVGTIPIAVIDRPGYSLAPLSAPMARVFSRDRIDEANARDLVKQPPPAWTFLHAPLSALSSTMLRRVRKR